MRLDQLILRNLSQHRVSSLLTLSNVAFGALLVSAVLLLRRASSDAFVEPSRGYALVVGAPGSRLELVLNTVFHQGESPGLLRYGVLEELSPHASVELVVPYAVGDAFRGARVVGTTDAFFNPRFPYPAAATSGDKLSAGRPFRFDAAALGARIAQLEAGTGGQAVEPSAVHTGVREAVLGARVAERLDLRVGDAIEPTHGVEGGTPHESEQLWQVVGVLAPTSTPLDDVVLINLDSFFGIEDHRGGILPETGKAGISALLVFPKPGVHKALLLAQLNKRTELQVADVDAEVRRLLGIIGHVDQVFFAVSVLVVLIGVTSVSVAIYNTLAARRREIAILRILGARRPTLFAMVAGEAIALCAVGGALGIVLGHALVGASAGLIERRSGVRPNAALFLPEELLAYGMVILAGALVSSLPALAAYRTDAASGVTPES